MPLPSPGLLPKHYSPNKRLILASEFDPKSVDLAQVARIVFQPPADSNDDRFGWTTVLSGTGDLEEVARNLFAAIRDADESPYEIIVIEECSLNGLGAAIMDRIKRAAS